MESASLNRLLLNDASRLYDEVERKHEFVAARHFVEVASDKRKKEPYLVANVLVVKVVRSFETRDEAWEFAYDLARWARVEEPHRGRKQDSCQVARRGSRMPRTALKSPL